MLRETAGTLTLDTVLSSLLGTVLEGEVCGYNGGRPRLLGGLTVEDVELSLSETESFLLPLVSSARLTPPEPRPTPRPKVSR